MTGTIRDIMKDSMAASYDPSSQYRASLRTLLSVTEGRLDNISAANPVIYAIENQAALIAGFIETLRSETGRLLQVHALEPKELYSHMSDVHFTNIFNLPASTTLTLVLEKKEILAAMVPIEDTMAKKVTIPRNSYFTVGNLTFGIHYPIDIIQQFHGGLRVVYDTSSPTPFQSLTSNTLNYRTVSRDGIEYLSIDIDVFQFAITSKTPSVTKSTSFDFKVDFSDLYYGCRIYRTLPDGTQAEISVTYSDEVYDPLKPTATVRVFDNHVIVKIPQIYITDEKILGELRIDVYSTTGPMNAMFDAYPVGSIGHRFRDLDKRAKLVYTAPIQRLGTCMVLAEKIVTGGALAMTFQELRNAVIADGLGDPVVPISQAQIQNYLSRRGYDIIKQVDTVTDRLFLATKDMPEPTNISLLTAASGSIETLNASFDELITSSYVINNGATVTLKPQAIFRLVGGLLRIVPDAELKIIRDMRRDLMATFVTEGGFLYSPYHYVLDKSNDRFRVTPYYLDAPAVTSQTFANDSEATLLQVGTNGPQLTKTDTGYKLTVLTRSSDAYKALQNSDLYAVLGFTPPGEDDTCWITGKLLGQDPKSKERIFEFDLGSRFSMDEEDRIDFRNFKMYDTSAKTLYADLDQEFTLIYGTKSQVGYLWKPGTIDAKLPRYLVPHECVGITEEVLTLHFGDALSKLWAQSRSVASAIEYETHAVDVLMRYKADVYKKDPATGGEFFLVGGVPKRIRLFKEGDPILDKNDKTQIQFPKGSVKTDPTTGLPIPKKQRYLKHRFDLFLIEGVYAFSNDEIAIAYRNMVAQAVARWVVEDLNQITSVTMDNTKVYFYPKTVFGTVDVMVTDGVIRQMNAAQRFDVTLTVPQNVMRNDELKSKLRQKTVEQISAYLKNRRMANSDIVDLLRMAGGEDVIDAQVSLFGELADVPAMMMVDEVHRCGIRKRLVARDDELLVVEEDINVVFSTITKK